MAVYQYSTDLLSTVWEADEATRARLQTTANSPAEWALWSRYDVYYADTKDGTVVCGLAVSIEGAFMISFFHGGRTGRQALAEHLLQQTRIPHKGLLVAEGLHPAFAPGSLFQALSIPDLFEAEYDASDVLIKAAGPVTVVRPAPSETLWPVRLQVGVRCVGKELLTWQTVDALAEVSRERAEVTLTFEHLVMLPYDGGFGDDTDIHLMWKGFDLLSSARNRPRWNKLTSYCSKSEEVKMYLLQGYFDRSCSSLSLQGGIDRLVVPLAHRPEYVYTHQAGALRDALVFLYGCQNKAARRLQRAWRMCVSNPTYLVARKRLLREYQELA
ncbi:hypothetical protein WJX72_005901 [[Myrmecia] bisecta]|uniref:Uncharacterized protein n=1 Tax=[Myrmecia] bisecta TaxID=41462 RepID=A0AAW1P6H4_9CHLO